MPVDNGNGGQLAGPPSAVGPPGLFNPEEHRSVLFSGSRSGMPQQNRIWEPGTAEASLLCSTRRPPQMFGLDLTVQIK